jgi:coenzyme F420-0:L-glutamate ligase/coenzyme F420-1:gamma-L-glutamate ligase
LSSLYIRSLSHLPEIRAGDDVAQLIVAALSSERPPGIQALMGAAGGRGSGGRGSILQGETVVIAHKAVSKAEGAVVALANVVPEARAQALASEQGRDPRAVQVVLDQSAEVLRAANGVLICRTHHGYVCANAGVDASNATDADTLIVLPEDPDASARRIRARLRELTGTAPAVLITDSFGRAWRHGQCDVAIGCAGMTPLEDWRGRTDGAGLKLHATWLAIADAVAGAADLVRAKDSREPVAIVAGLERFVTAEDGPGAGALLRPLQDDLFR